jgi:hypothetical protein
MQRALSALAISAGFAITGSCISDQDATNRLTSSVFTAEVNPVASITFIGADTLSDSARIYRLEPEPDGGSVAFLFADPGKGITQGLGIVQASGGQRAQVGWPDSVLSVWWSNSHQLSFTAGTGQGVRLVVDVHAAELKAAEVPGAGIAPQGAGRTGSAQLNANALSRAQAFIDSVRVQPAGMPQRSALRYEADSTLVGPGDTLAAVHVSAGGREGSKVNPAWYLVHLPSGQVQLVDSLTGRSPGLPASAGQWAANGLFYYAKDHSIWRAEPKVQ